MNDPENKTMDSANLAELKGECACLRRQLTMLLAAAVVSSLTLMAFIGLQAIRVNKDLKLIRPQVDQVTETLKKQGPSVESVTSKLTEYGRTHPDFAPMVAKYGLTNAPGPAPLAPLGTKK